MTSEATETILFETSPYGTIDGIVEHDGRVVYFYLNERPDPAGNPPNRFGTRACWVRNLRTGPMVVSKEEMAGGLAPMMPRNDCVDRDHHMVPDAESLEIVWFEEGNGAALVESGASGKRTIAVIPPWSGIDGFHGYASNCAHETPLAWPMPVNESLQLRIDRAAEFWSSFTTGDSPFKQLQPKIIQTFDSQFGSENQKQYYSIDGGKFPPRGMVRYETDSESILLTVGMSLCPQPAVELSVENPVELRRIEIGARIKRKENADEGVIESAMQSVGSWAAYPWQNQTWLGPGHSVDWAASNSGKAVLVRDNELTLPHFRNDPVSLLWLEQS